MTQREFYEKIINLEGVEGMDKDLIDFAQEGIDKLNKKNIKRQSTPSKSVLENIPIKESIIGYLAEMSEGAFAKDIGEALDITPNKATALCGQLVKEGKISVIKKKNYTKREVNFYFIPTLEKEEE